MLDSLWNLSLRNIFTIFARVVVAITVGCLGGLFGGLTSQILLEFTPADWTTAQRVITVLGWTATGLLVGASIGVFDVTVAALRNQDTRGAIRKIINGLIGGFIGGLIGGFLTLVLHNTWTAMFVGKPSTSLWSPSSYGFVALGACIGLFVALAQVFLKEAWLTVEEGFRKGRELILSKGEVTIGRAESCDIGLFGDNQIEKVHVTIKHLGNDYVLHDSGAAAGTYVNEQRVIGPRPLHAGDRIRLGRCVLRFGERAKS